MLLTRARALVAMLWIGLAAAYWEVGATVGPEMGLVVVSRGKAEIVRGGAVIPVADSTSLRLGDTVRAGPNSIVVVLRTRLVPVVLRNGETTRIETPTGRAGIAARRTPDAAESGLRSGALQRIAGLFLPKWVQTSTSADVLKSGEKESRPILLLYPVDGPVLRARPSFAWTSPHREHRIRLFDAETPILWLYEERVSESGRLRYPAHWPDLKQSAKYFWEVVDLPGERAVATAHFHVEPAESQARIRAGLASAANNCDARETGPLQCFLLQVAYLAEAGYRHEAIETLLDSPEAGTLGKSLNIIVSNLAGEGLPGGRP